MSRRLKKKRPKLIVRDIKALQHINETQYNEKHTSILGNKLDKKMTQLYNA